MGEPFKYLKGFSKDYVFPTTTKFKGEKYDYIQDYGGIDNKTIIEILFRQGKWKKDILLIHLALRLAQNLKIKLRKKPLTDKQWNKKYKKIIEKFEEGFEKEEDLKEENQK